MNWLLIVFLFATTIQAAYYLLVLSRFAVYHKTSQIPQQWQPVSIVICARNEAENLSSNLPLVLQQDYQLFEVIVVDDGSTDNTTKILETLAGQFSNLKIIRLEPDDKKAPGKKGALIEGIRASRNNFILLTDADCRPAGNQWVKLMTAPLHFGKEIVLGYSPYQQQKSFINWLIRWDTFLIALQYFSYSLIGIPYMGVGRNMAYHKKLFNPEIFSNSTLLSGDDDLFVQHAATARNTAIQISPEAHTISKPKETFGAWYRQKARHLSTGFHYKFIHKLLLSIFIISQLIFYLTFIALLWNKIYVLSVLITVVGRQLIQAIVFYRSQKKLNEGSLWITWLAYDILYVPIYLIFITSILWKTHTWK